MRLMTGIVALSLLLGMMIGAILGYGLATPIPDETPLALYQWDLAVSIGEQQAADKMRVECLDFLKRRERGEW